MRPKYSNINLNRKVVAAIKRLNKVKTASIKSLIKEIDRTRQLIITAIAENGQITPYNIQQLKTTIASILETRGQEITVNLSDNARRVFVKGIQVVDAVIESNNLLIGIPYLSETKLNILQNYYADLIKDISDDAKSRITREITLAQLGQKPVDDVIKEIGRNLESKSIFRTIANRAETIFKTEVNRIGNVASLERTKQFYRQIPDLQKTWVHSHVGIPRPGHLLLDGTTIPVNDSFKLYGGDGKIYYPQAPHDPILPAGECVNCKCMLVPTIKKILDITLKKLYI